MRLPLTHKTSLERCFEMGRDAAINGANTTNCHFSLFASPEMTQAWERGKESVESEKRKPAKKRKARAGGGS